MDTNEQLGKLVAALQAEENAYHTARGYAGPADCVAWKDRGRKFVAIDIGSSGAWLVEKSTGEIFNIKAYGVPDYNKKVKADIGNIATVEPKTMYNKRFNYLR